MPEITYDSKERGYFCGSTYIGREIEKGVYIEAVQNGRWVVRAIINGQRTPERIGEVFGCKGTYQACTMKGQFVAMKPLLSLAVGTLVERSQTIH